MPLAQFALVVTQLLHRQIEQEFLPFLYFHQASPRRAPTAKDDLSPLLPLCAQLEHVGGAQASAAESAAAARRGAASSRPSRRTGQRRRHCAA
eukprot:scaffold436_cov267-Pinguiococcus_pyrenoidosus.AAC.5